VVGERKGETGEHQLFAFLTTASNDVVRPIHAKAMPVILTKSEDWDLWLSGSIAEAIALQRPLPNELLQIVATGEKADLAPVDQLRYSQASVRFQTESGPCLRQAALLKSANSRRREHAAICGLPIAYIRSWLSGSLQLSRQGRAPVQLPPRCRHQAASR